MRCRNNAKLEYGGLGDGHHKFPAPCPDITELVGNFILQIPRQYQNIIWFRPGDLVWMADGNMRSRQEFALLIRVSVHSVVNKVRPNAAIVQQSVSLPGCAIAHDRLAVPAGGDEKFEELAFGFFHLFAEEGVGVQLFETKLLLPQLQGRNFWWVASSSTSKIFNP